MTFGHAILFATLALASPAAVLAQGDMPDSAELRAYTLTDAAIHKFEPAMKEINGLNQTHHDIDEINNEKNLDAMVAKLKTYPEMTAILTRNNLAPREFMKMFEILLGGMMIVEILDSGGQKMDALPDYISPANMAYIRTNHDAIKAATEAVGLH